MAEAPQQQPQADVATAADSFPPPPPFYKLYGPQAGDSGTAPPPPPPPPPVQGPFQLYDRQFDLVSSWWDAGWPLAPLQFGRVPEFAMAGCARVHATLLHAQDEPMVPTHPNTMIRARPDGSIGNATVAVSGSACLLLPLPTR